MPDLPVTRDADAAEDFAQVFAREWEQNLPRPVELPVQAPSAVVEGDQDGAVDAGGTARAAAGKPELLPPVKTAHDPAQDSARIAPDLHAPGEPVPPAPERRIETFDLPILASVSAEGDWQKQSAGKPSALPPAYPEVPARQMMTANEPDGSNHPAEQIAPVKWMGLHHPQIEALSARPYMPQATPGISLGTVPVPVAAVHAPTVSIASPGFFKATADHALPEHAKPVVAAGPAVTVPADVRALENIAQDQPSHAQSPDTGPSADRPAPVEAKPTVITTRGDGATDEKRVLRPDTADGAPPIGDEPIRTRFAPAGLHEGTSSVHPASSGAVKPTQTEKPDRPFVLETGPVATGLSVSARAEVPDASTDMRRPEPTRVVVQQMVDAAIRAVERPVELHLNPEELGRVRINMTITDALVTLNVQAERAETLDLMRRHSELLAQELRQLGYGAINFSFGQSGSGQEWAQDDASRRAAVAADVPGAPADIVAPQRYMETSLDIRL
ncbi:MAG: flagellar hook-length control protein FliK [Rhodobacterales bacterium]|nr:flagellar hook-length control protein FliK [Rhodobacterales bacterium]